MEALDKGVLMTPSDFRSTQVEFKLISLFKCELDLPGAVEADREARRGAWGVAGARCARFRPRVRRRRPRREEAGRRPGEPGGRRDPRVGRASPWDPRGVPREDPCWGWACGG